eukprot:1158505-Pelagomonas_calceolata.AAC.8
MERRYGAVGEQGKARRRVGNVLRQRPRGTMKEEYRLKREGQGIAVRAIFATRIVSFWRLSSVRLVYSA